MVAIRIDVPMHLMKRRSFPLAGLLAASVAVTACAGPRPSAAPPGDEGGTAGSQSDASTFGHDAAAARGGDGGAGGGAGEAGPADGGGAAGGTGGAGGRVPADGGGQPSATCTYADDTSFCDCLGWSCGGGTVKDASGISRTVYCGGCAGGTWCQPAPGQNPGAGTCGGSSPLKYDWQYQKIDVLVAMGENDAVEPAYDYAENIKDGRGYTVGKVGFCSGTGDFIIVARCYNDLKAGNGLAKYFGHRDMSGKAIDGLLYYNDAFVSTMMNQGETKLIDSLAAGSSFAKDCATAAADPLYRKCQDDLAASLYMAAAFKHAEERGLRGALTLGFIYDTELNFGEDDDPGGTPGALTTIMRADADYGASMPKDFADKPWEESKWLGYLIKERTIIMSKDSTWNSDMDQNATWEAARRLHTGKSNAPESATDLSMNYDIVSAYKAGASKPTPCWPTGLATNIDSMSSISVVTTNKSASATDQTRWKGVGSSDGPGDYLACPPNPTP
jgi:hypothetical protein